jgi:hypothetical protein
MTTTAFEAQLDAGVLFPPAWRVAWLYCDNRSYGSMYQELIARALKGGYLKNLPVETVYSGEFKEAHDEYLKKLK